MRHVLSALCAMVVVGSGTNSWAADFPSAVATVLAKQPQIIDLSPDRRREMIACVQKVLASVPPPKQRYVAEAANYDEMESRFGEVVLADRARFKQRITKECGAIATSG